MANKLKNQIIPMLKCFIYVSVTVLFMISCGSAAQQKYSSHAVQKGETVYSIAKDYHISEETVYNLNPDTRNGLKVNSVLILPAKNGVGSSTTPRGKYREHRVKRQETLFGIAQLYNVSIEDIKKLNKDLYSREIRKGEKLYIPAATGNNNESEASENTSKDIQKYTVKPKETKFGIARKYGITIDELEELNPSMGKELKVGETINIPKKTVVETDEIDDENFQYYEVKSKEGFFRLKQKFGISEEEIIALNPYAKDGLKDGMILKLPKDNVSISPEEIEVVNLERKISNRKMKTVALMLPFRLNGKPSDSTQTDEGWLKKDPTLRVALDFYSGALMAAEFAKDKGISVTMDVYDTEKNENVVSSIVSKSNFNNVDAVIGPLMQKNVERAAALLQKKEIPVFSPLSNREMNMYPNFFQTLPTQSVLDNTMLRYIKNHASGKNIVIIADSKNQGKKNTILTALPNAKSVSLRKSDYVQSSDVTPALQQGVENWVILESSNSVLVSSAVGVLSAMPNNYNIRLFTTDKNDAYEWHEVSSVKLAKLNFTFPSVNKTLSEEDRIPFAISYKNKYGVAPNRYAIRGFDVTYDVLLRLASSENVYDDISPEEQTVYVENKFRYIKNDSDGYSNQAAYILKYTKDLTFEIVE